MDKENITIIGCGWGCAGFIKYIDTNKYNVTVVSKDLQFTYTPLLTYSATQLNQMNIQLCNTTQHLSNINNKIKFIKSNVDNIDITKNELIMDKTNKKYDYLILSHGANVNTFNIKGIEEHTLFLKTNYDAMKIQEKINSMDKNKNIVIIGCGPTGAELIGHLIDTKKFNIYAIDGLPKPLSLFSDSISNYVINLWKKNNVHLNFNNFVTHVDHEYIHFKNNKIKYDLAIWCGGVKPNSLTNVINKQLTHINPNDCKFGIPVNNMLQVQNNIFAIGDCANSGLPPTAQVAYQQGKYLANNFNNKFKNNEPFKFENKGQICYIGNKKSVYQINTFQSSGNLTYYINQIIHIYNAININQKCSFIKSFLKDK
jgi:NADH:ubiquinone reductase (non-electrogenic)